MVTPTAASIVSRMRLKRQLSKTAFAELIGLPASTITRIESGLVEPTYAMLQRIAFGAGFQLTETLSDSGSDLPWTVSKMPPAPSGDGSLGNWHRQRIWLQLPRGLARDSLPLILPSQSSFSGLKNRGRILLFRRWRLSQVMFPRPVPSLPSCMWTILKS